MKKGTIAILEVVGIPAESKILALASGQVAVLPKAQGRSIHCLVGSLWVTREGDAIDHVIEAGKIWRVEGRGKIVLSALGDSSCRVA
jgi:hypothetical protein